MSAREIGEDRDMQHLHVWIAMARPPTFQQLVKGYPAYRKYLRRRPKPNASQKLNHPWQIWTLRDDRRWRSRLCVDYDEAYGIVVGLYRQESPPVDIYLISRTTLYKQPLSLMGLVRDYPQLEWCGRCRRPTTFRYMPEGHRALRGAPVLTTDEAYRCYGCGIRRSMGGFELL